MQSAAVKMPVCRCLDLQIASNVHEQYELACRRQTFGVSAEKLIGAEREILDRQGRAPSPHVL